MVVDAAESWVVNLNKEGDPLGVDLEELEETTMGAPPNPYEDWRSAMALL